MSRPCNQLSKIKDRFDKLSAKDGGNKFPRPFTELKVRGQEVPFPRPNKGGSSDTSTRSLPIK